VLGKGEARYEQFFRELERSFPTKARALIEYDRDLSKRIYAACDIFVMPSASEPCGLSQMIASRYGAIPVVRETGGLYDSIKGYWEKDGELLGNGFTFANYSSSELYDRICAAVQLWREDEKRDRFTKKIMNTDFSWSVSARRYFEMYNEII
jgi:starch synthase